MCPPQKKSKTQPELHFFTIHLCFFTSKKISTNRKLNLPLTNSIYSIHLVFVPLEMQRRLKETKIYHTFFLLCLRGKDPENIGFSSVYVIGTTCFSECFFFFLNWKILLVIKVYRFSEIFLTARFVFSMKPVF